MNILVTGATGFVGKALVSRLTASGHRVVPLCRAVAASASEASWNPETRQVHLLASVPLGAVVHLAGDGPTTVVALAVSFRNSRRLNRVFWAFIMLRRSGCRPIGPLQYERFLF